MYLSFLERPLIRIIAKFLSQSNIRFRGLIKSVIDELCILAIRFVLEKHGLKFICIVNQPALQKLIEVRSNFYIGAELSDELVKHCLICNPSPVCY